MVCSKFEIRQVLRHSTRRLYQWALYRGLDEAELWWDRRYHKHSLCSPKINGSKKCLKNFRSPKKCHMYYRKYEKQRSFFNVMRHGHVSSGAIKNYKFLKVVKNRQVFQIYEETGQVFSKRWEKHKVFRIHEKITRFSKLWEANKFFKFMKKVEVSLKRWWKSQV